MRWNLLSIGLLYPFIVIAQQCGPDRYHTTPTARFAFAEEGSVVVDQRTGLQWRRCAEGQRWISGACRGSPETYTVDEKQVFTQSDSNGWRLPNIRELTSIIELGCVNPSINLTVFPNTPASGARFWSSTPYKPRPNFSWQVDFDLGQSSKNDNNPHNMVRLVR